MNLGTLELKMFGRIKDKTGFKVQNWAMFSVFIKFHDQRNQDRLKTFLNITFLSFFHQAKTSTNRSPMQMLLFQKFLT